MVKQSHRVVAVVAAAGRDAVAAAVAGSNALEGRKAGREDGIVGGGRGRNATWPSWPLLLLPPPDDCLGAGGCARGGTAAAAAAAVPCLGPLPSGDDAPVPRRPLRRRHRLLPEGRKRRLEPRDYRERMGRRRRVSGGDNEGEALAGGVLGQTRARTTRGEKGRPWARWRKRERRRHRWTWPRRRRRLVERRMGKGCGR